MKSSPQKDCRQNKRQSGKKRLLYLGILFIGFASLLFGLSSPLSAQGNNGVDNGADSGVNSDGDGVVIVIKVNGLIDEIIADYIEGSIQTAEAKNAFAVVIQIDSENVILSKSRFKKLSDIIINSPVSTATWVGPSGANIRGRVAELAILTDSIGISPGASIGKISNCSNLQACEGLTRLENESVGYQDFLSLQETAGSKIVDSPTIGDLLLTLDGFESKEVKDDENCTQDCLIYLEPVSQVRFTRLSYLDQALHTVANPPIAYLLFSFGLGLIILEYYTAGVGISGVIGAISFLLGTYGLVALPTTFWAVILLLFGLFAYSIDIQTGVPRLWTIIATAAFTVGSIFLFHSGISLSWLILLIGIGSTLGGLAFALPVLVRSRFTTPTIGREWMITETGTVVEALNPNGIVEVHKALWKAKTFRSTPISVGTEIKIIEVDNLILEVEPKDMESKT